MATLNLRRDHQSLRDRVRDVVRDRIIRQQYRGGQRLTLEGLARDLGVSATPVRDALAQLERDGLVQVNARGTAIVRGFTREDLAEIFDLRLAVEPLAARLAALRLDARVRAVLRARLEAARQSLARGEVDLALDADRAVHAAILEACGNDRVVAVMQALTGQVEVFRARGIWARSPYCSTIHLDRMLDACDRGDAAEAASAMTEHLEVALREGLAGFDPEQGRQEQG